MKPINCNFYDHLEVFAMRKTPVRIVLTEEGEEVIWENVRILDLYVRDSVEYMMLGNGMEVPLANLVSVQGIKLDSFGL